MNSLNENDPDGNTVYYRLRGIGPGKLVRAAIELQKLNINYFVRIGHDELSPQLGKHCVPECFLFLDYDGRSQETKLNLLVGHLVTVEPVPNFSSLRELSLQESTRWGAMSVYVRNTRNQ